MLIGTLLATRAAAAVTTESTDHDESASVAATAEEPSASLDQVFNFPIAGWYLLLQDDTRLIRGKAVDGITYSQTLALQPLLAFPLGHTILFTRPYVAVERRPIPAPFVGDEHRFGLTDAALPLLWVPFPTWPVTLGVGPTFILPTATSDDLGQRHFQAGPAGAIYRFEKDWYAGVIVQQWWSVGEVDAPASTMVVQYYATLNLGPTLQLSTGPDVVISWNAPRGDRVNLPVGLGLYQLFLLGSSPTRVGAAAYYSVVREETAGTQWTFRLIFEPVILNPTFTGG